MILSHKHKFIFIKTNKTAGTSVEIALSRFCGPGDIITPISPRDEEVRQGLGCPGPQNCYATISHYGAKDMIPLLRGRRKLQFYNHMSASEIRELVPEDVWSNYYKFTIERNPWDRFLSFYYWHCQAEPRPSIIEFIENSPKMALLKQRGVELYSISNQVVVDKICRFERLADDLRDVSERLGLKGSLDLPVTKAGTRKDKRHYQDVLGKHERDAIAKYFSEEINLLGYSF